MTTPTVSPAFKVGDRVRYIGGAVAGLSDTQVGTVVLARTITPSSIPAYQRVFVQFAGVVSRVEAAAQNFAPFDPQDAELARVQCPRHDRGEDLCVCS